MFLTAQSACSTPSGSTSGTHARNASLSERHWHYSTSAACAAHMNGTQPSMLYFALLQPNNLVSDKYVALSNIAGYDA